jgi:hypothetical protein
LIAGFNRSIFDNHPFGRLPFDARAPSFALVKRKPEERKEWIEMMERLLDVEVTESGTVFEEIELICTMTGFRRRFLIHHIGEGFFQSVELF